MFSPFFSLLSSLVPLSAASALSYGPASCVEIAQEAKSRKCSIQTRCVGQDLSNVEFGFTCHNGHDRVVHSFGMNSFDNRENFLSDVVCRNGCTVPEFTDRNVTTSTETSAAESAPSSEQPVPEESEENLEPGQPALPTDDISFTVQKDREQSLRMSVSKFAQYGYKVGSDPGNHFSQGGPSTCARVWKSDRGSCLMQTQCSGLSAEELAATNFGLTCVMNSGQSAHHLFGKGSFDPEETFDTQIACSLCLAMDAQLVGKIEKAEEEKEKEEKEKEGEDSTQTTTTTPSAPQPAMSTSESVKNLENEVIPGLEKKIDDLAARMDQLEGSSGVSFSGKAEPHDKVETKSSKQQHFLDPVSQRTAKKTGHHKHVEIAETDEPEDSSVDAYETDDGASDKLALLQQGNSESDY